LEQKDAYGVPVVSMCKIRDSECDREPVATTTLDEKGTVIASKSPKSYAGDPPTAVP
jgi:hypothetical protein